MVSVDSLVGKARLSKSGYHGFESHLHYKIIIMAEQTIAELEAQIRQLKSRQNVSKWNEGLREIEEYVQKIKGIDICRFNLNKDKIEYITIYRILDVHYAETWGSNMKVPEIRCMALTIGYQYFPGEFASEYSTDTGHTVGDKYLRKIKSVDRIKLDTSSKQGFPIGLGKSWRKDYERIIDTGTLHVANACFTFGDDSRSLDDPYAAMMSNFRNFKMLLHSIPKNVFDSINKMYVKQCLETEALLKSIDLNGIKKI